MIDIETMQSRWEVQKIERIKLEQEFLRYTGHIDVVELHIPYTKFNELNVLINSTSRLKGSKVLISLGDSVNLDLFSRFHLSSTDESLPTDEINKLMQVFKEAEKVYDKIIFLTTNHEARLNKVIQYNFGDKSIGNELKKLMKSYKEMFIENDLTKIVHVPGYIFQIGDSVFTHFENNSVVAGAVSRSVIQYLIPRLHRKWNLCYNAHTHSQSKISIDGKTVIETGALIDSLDYWRNGKLNGKGKMSTYGYAYGEMDRGLIDINKANYHICGWEGTL